MPPKPRSYYRDESDSDISGLLVVATGDEGVRVTENRERGWCAPFWMPVEEFYAYTDDAIVSRVGMLSNEKFDKVLNKARPDDADVSAKPRSYPSIA